MIQRTTPRSAPAGTVLALVVAGTTLVVLDITIVTIGLPQIQPDLGGTLAEIQWVIIAYTVTMGAVTQAVGSLSDRLGRRRLYLAGVILFTLASLACGLAPTVLFLDAARVAQGIGGAILMTSALPLLSHAYQGQRRTMAITTWGTASMAAALVAPLLGGVLIDLLSWRAIFLINVPIGLAVLVASLLTLPADPTTDRAVRIDWAGMALLAAALGLGNFALIRGDAWGWAAPITVGLVAAMLVLLAAFVALQLRVPAPTLDPRLFRRAAFTGVALAVLMSRVLTVGGMVYVVQYADSSLHLGSTHTGLLLTPAFIAQVAAGMLAGKLLARFAAGRVIATGYLCKLVGGLWLGLVIAPAAEPWMLALPLLIWGTGGGIAGAPVMAVAMNVTDRERAGMVSGVITSLASIGAGLGTAVLGALYAARMSDTVDDHLPATTPDRDTVAAAIVDSNPDAALALVPPSMRDNVASVIEDATAAAASVTLLGSAALAALTTVVVLALINRRTVAPPTDDGAPPVDN